MRTKSLRVPNKFIANVTTNDFVMSDYVCKSIAHIGLLYSVLPYNVSKYLMTAERKKTK